MLNEYSTVFNKINEKVFLSKNNLITGSILLTMCLALGRFVTVCFPFFMINHRYWYILMHPCIFVSSRWSARRYIIPICILAFFYNIIKFKELEVFKSNMGKSNKSLFCEAINFLYNPWKLEMWIRFLWCMDMVMIWQTSGYGFMVDDKNKTLSLWLRWYLAPGGWMSLKWGFIQDMT